MASPATSLSRRNESGSDSTLRRLYRRLGLLNGLVLGIGLAIGVWLPQLAALLPVPVTPIFDASILTGALLVILIAALAGWTTAVVRSSWVTVAGWLVAAAILSLLIAGQPYQIPTRLVWLLVPALAGRVVYPSPEEWTTAGLLVSGLFIFLVLVLLALLQEYRLEGLLGERDEANRLTASGWLQLLLPLPFVIAAGVVTGTFYGSATAPRALRLTQEAIAVAARYEGDLFQLGREEGLNYAALSGVRDQLGGEYRLALGEDDRESGTTIVVAHFENGAWINCRLLNDQLNYCYDASPPYTEGFASLIGGRDLPAESNAEQPAADERWLEWLAQRQARFEGPPEIEFVAQWGSYVLMRAEAAGGGSGVECWFSGLQSVRLESCEEAAP